MNKLTYGLLGLGLLLLLALALWEQMPSEHSAPIVQTGITSTSSDTSQVGSASTTPDLVAEAGTTVGDVRYQCKVGGSFTARIEIMPIASQLGRAEVFLPDGTKEFLSQVIFAKAPDPRYENADGTFAFETDISITDGSGHGTFVEKDGKVIYSGCIGTEL